MTMNGFCRKNYYQIMGVPCDVDAEALKRAYRRRVKQCHPDRQPDDGDAEERFKELQEAYEILKDPGRRHHYDAFYFRERARQDQSAAKAWKSGPGFSDFVGDVFEFLKNRMENRGRRGEDLRYVVSLSLEETAAGARKIIRIPRRKVCSVCSGRGWTVPADTPVCKVCRGEGEISVPQGKTRVMRQCPGCGGRGLYEKKTCARCKGEGFTVYRVQRTVEVPAGVDSGTRLRMKGEGSAGSNGGESGDLYIVIQVKDHPTFKRRNLDLWSELFIHFTQAALGAEIQVSTLQEPSRLTIPPGTQSGDVFTLKGRGMPGLNGSVRGDQKIRVHVEVPRKLSEDEKEILRSWQEVRKARNHPRSR